LRLYSPSPPDPGLYQQAKNFGFAWSDKLNAFVAPKWTPEREDFLIALCGGIGDELADLVNHAKPDAASGRRSDARCSSAAHDLDDDARREALVWRSSEYWVQRATAATCFGPISTILPAQVRWIKVLEADKRRQEELRSWSQRFLNMWRQNAVTLAQARAIAKGDRLHVPLDGDQAGPSVWVGLVRGCVSLDQARAVSIKAHEAAIARAERWIDHYEKRLAYARAILAQTSDPYPRGTLPEVGGACQFSESADGKWSYIRRVNKVSVTVLDTWDGGAHTFPSTIPFGRLARLMSPVEVESARISRRLVETPDATGFVLREAPAPQSGSLTPAPNE
jgi:hypothetical protein